MNKKTTKLIRFDINNGDLQLYFLSKVPSLAVLIEEFTKIDPTFSNVLKSQISVESYNRVLYRENEMNFCFSGYEFLIAADYLSLAFFMSIDCSNVVISYENQS